MTELDKTIKKCPICGQLTHREYCATCEMLAKEDEDRRRKRDFIIKHY